MNQRRPARALFQLYKEMDYEDWPIKTNLSFQALQLEEGGGCEPSPITSFIWQLHIIMWFQAHYQPGIDLELAGLTVFHIVSYSISALRII